MKKSIAFLLTLITLATAFSAFAQVRRDPRIDPRPDRRPIVRIEVGDERDEREMLRRIYRLEQAVRDLQDQIYQQSLPRTITRHVCSAEIFSVGPLIGRGLTRVEAINDLLTNCRNRRGTIFCEERHIERLRCETVEEPI